MLWSSAPEFSLLCSNYAPLCSILIQHFLSLIIPKLHNHEYQQPFQFFYSLNNLSMYTYQHFEFPFVAFCNFSQYILTKSKSLPHINPNLTILGKTCILYNFFHYAGNFCLSIMLALCSMLLPPYYVQNYAGIIGPIKPSYIVML